MSDTQENKYYRKHNNPVIHQVHIADGFADDCEELIHRWLMTETLTYETFCDVWKSMQFSYVYHGRTSGAEMAELSEELIYIAKHYMVANTSNFEESVAGVFLVYAILNLQPYPGFAALRIVPADIPAINRIETVARRQRRYDVLYILGSILTEGPVQYHVDARERGMESCIRKYLDGYTGIDRAGIRPKGVFYRQNEELDLLRELNVITGRYSNAVKKIEGSNRSLNYTNPNLASELDSSLKRIINGIIDEDEESNKELSKHLSAVQAIKDKAMRQTVDSVRFLRSTQDDDTSPKTKSPKSKSEIAEPSGMIKQASPKKVIRRGKRKPVKVPKRKLKKQKVNSKNCSSPNSDYVRSSFSSESKSSNDDTDQFTLDNFDKANDNDDKEQETTEREIEIEIESLPVLFRTEQDGKCFEIEIIDELKNKTVNDNYEDPKAKIEMIGEVSIRKINCNESTSNQTEDVKDINVTLNESLKLKRCEKRDQKKTILKSKFKRLGMLDVANFENTDRDAKNNTNNNS